MVNRWCGQREFEAETLTITLNSLAAGSSRISTQYSFSGLSNGVFPLKGWLDVTIDPALDPTTSGALEMYLVPGTSGTPSLGLSATDADVTFSASFGDFAYYIGSIDHADATAASFQRRVFLGHGGMWTNAQTAATSFVTTFNTDLGATADLPRYWSLVVKNGWNQALASSGNTVTFTPVFDVEKL